MTRKKKKSPGPPDGEQLNNVPEIVIRIERSANDILAELRGYPVLT